MGEGITKVAIFGIDFVQTRFDLYLVISSFLILNRGELGPIKKLGNIITLEERYH